VRVYYVVNRPISGACHFNDDATRQLPIQPWDRTKNGSLWSRQRGRWVASPPSHSMVASPYLDQMPHNYIVVAENCTAPMWLCCERRRSQTAPPAAKLCPSKLVHVESQSDGAGEWRADEVDPSMRELSGIRRAIRSSRWANGVVQETRSNGCYVTPIACISALVRAPFISLRVD